MYSNRGAAYLELERPQSDAQMFALAKEIMDVSLGPHHADSIDIVKTFQKLMAPWGASALEFQQRVIDVWESHGPTVHDETREARQLLEQLKENAQGSSWVRMRFSPERLYLCPLNSEWVS